MSQSSYILNLLNIKDKNIKLNENCLFYEKFDDIIYKVIEGNLSYKPPFCTRCGCVFNDDQTYEKNGFKSSDILLLDVCGRPAFAASKILNIDGEYITFWYQRHEDDLFVVETIHIFEFIKRIIIHIPEYQFKTIRYYGFYSKKSKFHNKMIMLVHPMKIEFSRKFNKWFLLSMKTFKDSPLICSKCKTVIQFQYFCT